MTAFLVAIALLVAAPKSPCAPRAHIVERLNSLYHEKQEAVGVVNGQAVIEVFVSPEGTWTIIATAPDGNSCMLSSGTAWQSDDSARGST